MQRGDLETEKNPLDLKIVNQWEEKYAKVTVYPALEHLQKCLASER